MSDITPSAAIPGAPAGDGVTATSRGARLAPSAMHPSDLFRVASIGLRSRRLRASLSALGIAIGIAAMVAVLGISDSSKSWARSTITSTTLSFIGMKTSFIHSRRTRRSSSVSGGSVSDLAPGGRCISKNERNVRSPACA